MVLLTLISYSTSYAKFENIGVFSCRMGVSGLDLFLLMVGTAVTLAFFPCGALLYLNSLVVFNCRMGVSDLRACRPCGLDLFVDGGDTGQTSFLALRALLYWN